MSFFLKSDQKNHGTAQVCLQDWGSHPTINRIHVKEKGKAQTGFVITL